LETQQIVEILRPLAEGQSIGYEEIARQIGHTVPELLGTSWLVTAIRRLQRDYQVVFKRIDKTVRHLTATENSRLGRDIVHHIRRKAHRNAQRLVLTPPEKLPVRERASHFMALNLSCLIEAATKPKAQKRIEAHIQQTPQRLPVDAILALLLSHNGK